MYLRQFTYLSDEGKSKLKNFHPQDYWSTEGRVKFYNLSIIAARLFSIPSSNVSSERNWNVHGGILTKKRNVLKEDKVEKLVFVTTNAFLLDANDKTNYLDVE